ncbi:MAG: tripeptide aminopeptidase [Saprospiraceae bacterium]|jgi:tripeptide aminopeptidase
MNFKKYSSLIVITLLLIGFVSAQDISVEIQSEFRNEIKALVLKPKIINAFKKIIELEEETESEHIQLNEVPAPPFKEMERALLFQEMINWVGVDSSWIDEVGNVIALRKGKSSARTVCLDAHLDTVFPEGTDVRVRIKGDTLMAPGIGDDTRGLAILLAVLKAMNDASIYTEDDVLFIASVGEEGLGDLRGVKHIFSEGPKVDSWISIDGGSIGRVNTQGLGSYRYRVKYIGPGGHSWGAFGLVNPHHALGDAIARFVERADEYTMTGPRTSYNVGIISGGTSVNSIPFESIMEIDMRSVDPTRLDTMEVLLKTSIQEALDVQNGKKRLGAPLTVETIQIGNRPSGELDNSLPLIQRTMAATAYMGKRPKITRGSTNSNIPIAMGIPAVTIGRGGIGGNAHALDEWWLNKEGYKAIQLAMLTLIAEAGFATY